MRVDLPDRKESNDRLNDTLRSANAVKHKHSDSQVPESADSAARAWLSVFSHTLDPIRSSAQCLLGNQCLRERTSEKRYYGSFSHGKNIL